MCTQSEIAKKQSRRSELLEKREDIFRVHGLRGNDERMLPQIERNTQELKEIDLDIRNLRILSTCQNNSRVQY